MINLKVVALTRILAAGLCLLFAASPVAAADENKAVRVVVRSTAGSLIEDAYVAFTAPDRPAWRPSLETIALRGVTTVQLPRGTYKVFAGARGHQDATRSLNVTAATSIEFDLPPSVPIHGVVHDVDGRPIAGAAVRHLRLAGPVQTAQVSAMARRYFENDWSTQTDARGQWTLPGRSDGQIPVLFEASGFAPAHEFRAASPDAGVTVLRRGGTLRVALDRSDATHVLALVYDSGNAKLAGWEGPTWMRVAEQKVLAWDSLPAGTYRILVNSTDPRTFTRPSKLADVTIAEGESPALQVTLPKSQPPVDDVLVAFIAGPAADDLLGLRAIASTPRGSEEVRYAVERASGGTLLYLRTLASPSDLFLHTPERVIRVAAATNADAPIPTTVSPRADLSIRLQPPEDRPPLRDIVRAHFEDCGALGGSLSIAAVPAENVVNVPFPTACHNIVLRVPPFEPVILHPTIAARERKSLGPFTLKLAGSASIRVVRDPSDATVPGARVRALIPGDHGSLMAVADGTADAEGKLLLGGLPGDREVTLEASEPESQFTGTTRVRIEAGRTTVVDRLAIPQPATLIVAPRLAADFRTRYRDAKIQSITIDPLGTVRSEERRSASLNEAGEAVFERLRPGRWQALVLIQAAGTMQPLPLDPVELASGDSRLLDDVLEPPVFEGRVVSRGEGVYARVAFGDPPGPESLTRSMNTDRSGRFAMLLPKTGTYRVSVMALTQDPQLVELGELQLDDPNVPVTIELPQGTLRVRVRDDEKPLANSNVTATLVRTTSYGHVAETVRSVKTGADGEARLESMLPGRWLIQATDAASARRGETVAEVRFGESSDVEITLERSSALRGVVRHPDGSPAAGATVACLFVGSSRLPQGARVDAGADGRFEIELSTPPPAALQCGVTTAGGQIATFRLNPSADVDLTLPADVASLQIADWGRELNRDLYWLVSSDGRAFNLSWAAAKLTGAWAPLAIPRAPAGSWRVVRAATPEDRIRLASGAAATLPAITAFRLESGTSETIRIHGEKSKSDPVNERKRGSL